MKNRKEQLFETTGSIQVCAAGHKSGAEAAIHAMHDMLKVEETEAILLIDADNAFNSINRTVILRNISWNCPILSTYINKLLLYTCKSIHYRRIKNNVKRRNNP